MSRLFPSPLSFIKPANTYAPRPGEGIASKRGEFIANKLHHVPNSISSFVISQLEQGGAKPIATALSSKQSISSCFFSDCSAYSVATILTGLKTHISMIHLQFQRCAMDPKQAALIATFLKTTQVTTLDVSNNPVLFRKESGRAALASVIQSNGLGILNLSNTGLTHKSAATIASALPLNPGLVALNLSGNFYGGERRDRINADFRMTAELTSALISSRLSILDLSNLNLNDEDAVHIALLIKTTPSLKLLNLSGNQFTNAGAKLIGEALSKNRTLETLDLSGNNIGNEGIGAISEDLARNSLLKQLFINNIGITTAGAESILALIKKNKALAAIELNGNAITPSRNTEIQDQLIENKRPQLHSVPHTPPRSTLPPAA